MKLSRVVILLVLMDRLIVILVETSKSVNRSYRYDQFLLRTVRYTELDRVPIVRVRSYVFNQIIRLSFLTDSHSYLSVVSIKLWYRSNCELCYSR